jgi:hypothetical protein
LLYQPRHGHEARSARLCACRLDRACDPFADPAGDHQHAAGPGFGFLFPSGLAAASARDVDGRTALPLGFLSDLVNGHPIGQSMALWTLTFLILDIIESRAVFKDYWLDWLLASLLILFHTWEAGSSRGLWVAMPSSPYSGRRSRCRSSSTRS